MMSEVKALAKGSYCFRIIIKCPDTLASVLYHHKKRII